MNKFLPKTIIFFCLFLTAVTAMWLPLHAQDEPTAVHLASFDVVPLNNAVRIDWETGSENDTLAFRIKRSAPGGNAIYLDYVGDNGYIWSVGGVVVGSTYSVTDDRVQNGETYTYILIEVETSGNEIEQGRETVTVGIPPTNTPVVISNPGNNSSNTQTPTATSASGASTSATASPTTQSESQEPTNTPPAFVTITPNTSKPTATPASNENTTSNNQSGTSNTNISSSTDRSEETSNISLSSVAEVFAQEESDEEAEVVAQSSLPQAPQTQDGYPAEESTATAVSETNETYPENVSSDEAAATPVPVIGNTNGYAGQEDQPTNINTRDNTTATQGRIFLWLGFIVAGLIFVTGLIGSILLFTRKTN